MILDLAWIQRKRHPVRMLANLQLGVCGSREIATSPHNIKTVASLFISMGLRASEMPPCITSSANDLPVQGAQIAVSQHGMNRFRVAQIITIAITPV